MTAASDPMASTTGPMAFAAFGKEQSEAMVAMQKEVLAAYQEASRVWVERVKSEIELWSELAAKLSASRSVPDGLEAYRDSIAQRVQMATEDGRRLFEDGQKIIAAITRSLEGWPKVSS